MKNGCPNQASKQLKPNGQMERMVKMTKKDQGERGGKYPLQSVRVRVRACVRACVRVFVVRFCLFFNNTLCRLFW